MVFIKHVTKKYVSSYRLG